MKKCDICNKEDEDEDVRRYINVITGAGKAAKAKLEEIEKQEKERFKPAGGYFFDVNFHVNGEIPESDFDGKNYNQFAEYFEAVEAARFVNAMLKLRHIAFILNAGWIPDYINSDGFWCPVYLPKNKIWVPTMTVGYVSITCPAFKSKELAAEAIHQMGEDLKYLNI